MKRICNQPEMKAKRKAIQNQPEVQQKKSAAMLKLWRTEAFPKKVLVGMWKKQNQEKG